MGLWDRLKPDLEQRLREANPHLNEAQIHQISNELETEVESQPPPRIAFIGMTGVGKSSTLNALFNAGAEISHSVACTQSPVERKFQAAEFTGAKGGVVVFDMPGIGQDIKSDEQHYAAYEKVLPDVDVVVWVFPAEHREMTATQYALMRLSKSLGPKIIDRMVFAINKVDLLHPGPEHWNPHANMPSDEQVRYMRERSADITDKIRQVVPWTGEVVAYSALRRYRLPHLMDAVLDSAAKNRAWLFGARASIADFRELVDPRLLKAAEQARAKMDRR